MKYLGLILVNLLLAWTASAHGISDADKQGILEGGNLEYIKLGATHMLTGYDHLLFLFGVMFFLARFGDIVKFITAFTLGHCVTLVFATLLHIKANYYLVDAVIVMTAWCCEYSRSISALSWDKSWRCPACGFCWRDGARPLRS